MEKGLPFKAIGTIVTCSDAVFAKTYARVSPEEYADFLRVYALRLKVMKGKAAQVSPPPP